MLGVANKSLQEFCDIATRVAAPPEKARFEVVGFLEASQDSKPTCPYLGPIADRPLRRCEFEERMAQVTYVISVPNPQKYRLALSATLLDALAFTKPGIYLRNDFVEHYHRELGDIGYLCPDLPAVVHTVKDLIAAWPSERYHNQVATILQGRERFRPEVVAPQLQSRLGL